MASKERYYFYVLACRDGSLYTGYTTDPDRRQAQHLAGTAAKYTRPASRRPNRMVMTKAFSTKSLAMSCEYHFKQLSRQEKEAELYQAGVADLDYASSAARVDLDCGSPFFMAWQAKIASK